MKTSLRWEDSWAFLNEYDWQHTWSSTLGSVGFCFVVKNNICDRLGCRVFA